MRLGSIVRISAAIIGNDPPNGGEDFLHRWLLHFRSLLGHGLAAWFAPLANRPICRSLLCHRAGPVQCGWAGNSASIGGSQPAPAIPHLAVMLFRVVGR